MSGFTTLIEAMGSGITQWLEILPNAIKNVFLNLIYVDPTPETGNPVVSEFAYFIFAFLGVAIVSGVVWFVLHMVKSRGR